MKRGIDTEILRKKETARDKDRGERGVGRGMRKDGDSVTAIGKQEVEDECPTHFNPNTRITSSRQRLSFHSALPSSMFRSIPFTLLSLNRSKDEVNTKEIKIFI